MALRRTALRLTTVLTRGTPAVTGDFFVADFFVAGFWANLFYVES